MNTNSKTNKSAPSPISEISKRKQDHINVCREDFPSNIEGKARVGFHSIDFIHTPFPELSCDEIDTAIEFLGKRISAPLFISCMTGGTEEGLKANRELAKAAQEMAIPIGLGSLRVLLSEPKRAKDFQIRSFAPDIPILGNIGAVQVRDSAPDAIKEMIDLLEIDALVIHLNCGQELFQHGGDRDFRGLKEAIFQAVCRFDIPIIVKETGFGIPPVNIKELLERGVAYVDIAGAGGTNWILVENARESKRRTAAEEFANWGNSTAVVLDAVKGSSEKILASGGIRSGVDLAKSIALGAKAGGMALPFIRASLEGGKDAVCAVIERVVEVLRTVMVLTGCKTVLDLQKIPLLRTKDFEHNVSTLKSASC